MDMDVVAGTLHHIKGNRKEAWIWCYVHGVIISKQSDPDTGELLKKPSQVSLMNSAKPAATTASTQSDCSVSCARRPQATI